jgi:hypothetical protein
MEGAGSSRWCSPATLSRVERESGSSRAEPEMGARGGGREMGMGFSCCGHTWDKVAVHMGRRCMVVRRHRVEVGSAVGFKTD